MKRSRLSLTLILLLLGLPLSPASPLANESPSQEPRSKAQSQPPPPSRGELQHPDQNHGAKQQSQAQQDQRGTPDSPLFIKVIPSPNTQDEAAKAERIEEKHAAQQRHVEIITASYAAIAASAVQALAVIATIIVMIVTAVRQMRAYIGIEHVEIDSNTLHWEIIFKNFGKTIAKETEIWIVGRVETIPAKTDFSFLGERKCKIILMPNESSRFHEPVQLGQHDGTLLKQGIGFVLLWGKVKYRDVFGFKRWTTFRFEASWDGAYKSQYTDQGNDAT